MKISKIWEPAPKLASERPIMCVPLEVIFDDDKVRNDLFEVFIQTFYDSGLFS